MRRTLASLLCTLGLAAPLAWGADPARLERAHRGTAAARWTELVDDRMPATAVDALRSRLPSPPSSGAAADGGGAALSSAPRKAPSATPAPPAAFLASSAPSLEPPREVLLDPRALDRLASSVAPSDAERRAPAPPTDAVAVAESKGGAASSDEADAGAEVEPNALEGRGAEEDRGAVVESGEAFAEPGALATLPAEGGCAPIEAETLVPVPTAPDDSTGRVRTPDEEAADARRKAWTAELGAPLERSWEHRDAPRLRRFQPAPSAPQASTPSNRPADSGAESVPVNADPSTAPSEGPAAPPQRPQDSARSSADRPTAADGAGASKGWRAHSKRSVDRRAEVPPVKVDPSTAADDAGRTVRSGAVPHAAAPLLPASEAASRRRAKAAPPSSDRTDLETTPPSPPAAPTIPPPAALDAGGDGSGPAVQADPPSIQDRADLRSEALVVTPAPADRRKTGSDPADAPFEAPAASEPAGESTRAPRAAARGPAEADLEAEPIEAPLTGGTPATAPTDRGITESDLESVPMEGPVASATTGEPGSAETGGEAAPRSAAAGAGSGGAAGAVAGSGGADADQADWDAVRRWQASGAAARAAALARMKPLSRPPAAVLRDADAETNRSRARPAPSEAPRDAAPRSPADGTEPPVMARAVESDPAPSKPALSRERLRSWASIGPAAKTPVVVRVAPPPSIPLTRDSLRTRGPERSRPSSRR